MASEQTLTAQRASVVIHCEECKGCGRCIAFCPNGVLEWSDATNRFGYRIAAVGDVATCTGCGICFYACPEPGGITVYKKTAGKNDDTD